MENHSSYLAANRSGRLAQEQHEALHRLIRWRLVFSWVLALCCALLAGVTTFVILDEGLPRLFALFDVLYVAGFVFGVYLIVEQSRNLRALHAVTVRAVRGAPRVVLRAVAIPNVPMSAGGMMLLFHLRAGVVKLDKHTYGTLPGVFAMIRDGEPATVYVVDVRFGGIDGVIVNYTPA